MRVGSGTYNGRYDDNSSFFLGGILFSKDSNAYPDNQTDILIYSIADALLGAAASGGIYQSPEYQAKLKNPASELLQKIEKDVHYKGFRITNIDISILTSYKECENKIVEMHSKLVSWLYLKTEQLNIKIVPLVNADPISQEYQIKIMTIVLLEHRF